MPSSVSDQCRSCLITLQEVISILSKPDHNDGRVKHAHVSEDLDRFSLFVGNIGALQEPQSPMSIESRLQDANHVLTHILGLLADLEEVAAELLEIVSGKREGMISVADKDEEGNGEEISEVNELREEVSGTITRLFRISTLIRQAAPTDLFAKALSRDRYRFSDQFDIAHVGDKYRKLAIEDYAWLRQRLGRAITQRRRYLSYIQDHHEKLGGIPRNHDKADSSAARSQAPIDEQPLASKLMFDTASRPSFVTKATTVAAERITTQLLVAGESDPEDDSRSYTTISRSFDGDHESSTTVRIPKLDSLRVGNQKEFECPFCFRIKKFKSERIWRKHVFSDLRPYVCTFPDCDAPYFGDINKWFQHEMTLHRVLYKCFLCPNKTYYQEKNYLSHLNKEHAMMLDASEQQQARDLARKPLAQIPASDCPCCSDWVDRLKEQINQTSRLAPNETLAVTPTIFKRHLAGHLEQLALFAVPIGATTDDDNNSNAAIEERKSERTDASQLSTLTFASLPDEIEDVIPEMEVDSSKHEAPHTNIQVPEIEKKANPVQAGTVETTLSKQPTRPKDEDTEVMEPQTFAQRERELGLEHPETLTNMSNSASVLDNQGRYGEAAAIHEQTLALREKVLGPEHPDTLASMANLAWTYSNQDRWDDAEKLELQVLETRKTKLGVDHPDTLASMANLAWTYKNQGRWNDAEKVEVQVLETRKTKLGADHPDTLNSLSQLGLVLKKQGKYDEAEVMYQQALRRREKVLGREHPNTLTTMSQLGVVLERQGKYNEAEVIYQQALEGREKALRPEHPDTLTSVSQLGFVLLKQRKYKEAEAMCQRALEGREKVLGRENPDTLFSVCLLAALLYQKESYSAAVKMYQRAYEGRSTNLL
ncbi:hypothetical protein DE146DRAFT_767511 [Phaeosphaeria sp. MPI-PUGE-AT-0046c]|nr:hypothetical protein DE146DRAFT_767511 [Phaeosphaeria sp. MPI-PUGE-AT-0046c]